MNLKLYVVRHWVPFPSSEYGGIEGYVATSRAEVVEMILDETTDYYTESYPDFKERIEEVVENAQVFVLADTMTTGKQFEFTT